MGMLADGGLPVPAPVMGLDGSALLERDGTLIDMLTWIDGCPLGALPAREADYAKLGRLMARMHVLQDAWSLPARFQRPVWDYVGTAPTWGRFWENPALGTAQQAQLVEFRDHARHRLARLEHADKGLIHADLVPDNVLVQGDTMVPIDFDDGGFGHRLFDLATVTLRSRRTDPSGALALATLEGYHSLRSLDHAALPLFEALRACSYVGWNITRIAEDHTRNARFIGTALHSIGARGV
jgi:Ser/Thr protein kinase RdoA (MazF antagonist)